LTVKDPGVTFLGGEDSFQVLLLIFFYPQQAAPVVSFVALTQPSLDLLVFIRVPKRPLPFLVKTAFFFPSFF